jgi:hypothetical protein
LDELIHYEGINEIDVESNRNSRLLKVFPASAWTMEDLIDILDDLNLCVLEDVAENQAECNEP